MTGLAMKPALCRSCNASILWLHTANGERMPVDTQPVADGNLRIINGRAIVTGATIDLLDPTDDGTRYVSHFASCPESREWRK